MPYEIPWNEASPPGNLPANQIDTAIQNDKIATRERLAGIFGLTKEEWEADPIVPKTLELTESFNSEHIQTKSLIVTDTDTVGDGVAVQLINLGAGGAVVEFGNTSVGAKLKSDTVGNISLYRGATKLIENKVNDNSTEFLFPVKFKGATSFDSVVSLTDTLEVSSITPPTGVELDVTGNVNVTGKLETTQDITTASKLLLTDPTPTTGHTYSLDATASGSFEIKDETSGVVKWFIDINGNLHGAGTQEIIMSGPIRNGSYLRTDAYTGGDASTRLIANREYRMLSTNAGEFVIRDHTGNADRWTMDATGAWSGATNIATTADLTGSSLIAVHATNPKVIIQNTTAPAGQWHVRSEAGELQIYDALVPAPRLKVKSSGVVEAVTLMTSPTVIASSLLMASETASFNKRAMIGQPMFYGKNDGETPPGQPSVTLFAGWGLDSSVGTLNGYDYGGTVEITTGTSGLAAFPTFTFTFADSVAEADVPRPPLLIGQLYKGGLTKNKAYLVSPLIFSDGASYTKVDFTVSNDVALEVSTTYIFQWIMY